MKDYVLALMEMAESLKEDATIELLYYNLFPGATAAEIAAVSSTIEFDLDAAIIAFFKETNGFQLRWIRKDNKQYDPAIHHFQEGVFSDMDIRDWYLPDDGVINILPIKEVFEIQQWDDIIWSSDDAKYQRVWNGKEYNLLELMQSVRPFDIFSKERCMALQIDKSVKETNVVLLQSHYSNITDSAIIDFNTYMDFLIESKGAVKERKKFSV